MSEISFDGLVEHLHHASLALYLGLLGSPTQQVEQTRNAVNGLSMVLA